MKKNSEIKITRISIGENSSTELRYIDRGYQRDTTILILPALGIAARSYSNLLQSLANEGYSSAVFDLRSQGNSSIKASKDFNYGYHELLNEDIPSAIDAVYSLFGKPIKLLGHSLGGQLGCLYAIGQDYRIESLILCTSGSVYYKSWDGFDKIRVLVGTQFARFYAYLLGYFPGEKFNFGGRTFQRLIEDWGQQALTGYYKIMHSQVDYEKGLSSIRIPILLLHLKIDFYAPPKAVLHLCKKLKSASLTQCCIDESTLNHFNWLRKPMPFIEKIVYWDENLSKPTKK